ncbi:MAG: glycosyltransferase [Deltaproteobacteria bacterium]|nr:glycosyltransferase [Deltaproteobacteria bacterium]
MDETGPDGDAIVAKSGKHERKHKLLVLVVAYHAQDTLGSVLQRIPVSILDDYDVEVLVIDDASGDETFAEGKRQVSLGLPFSVRILANRLNQGYGGNQKIGYHYAIEHGFDFVALIHGDGQYAPERLPDLLRPFHAESADAVFGSRMLRKTDALRGGMPLYKWVGNIILSTFQNRILDASLSEFHSGYRVYRVAALAQVPFHLNSNDFHFDTEIIIQFMRACHKIVEVPIPTYYGDEICRVDGLKYAWNVAKATSKAKLQDVHLLYDRKYDCAKDGSVYELKDGYESSHTIVLSRIPAGPGVRILDIGCASGYLGRMLRAKGAYVTGIDVGEGSRESMGLDQYIRHDLNADPFPVDIGEYDYVLLLDVIEHLVSPERFLDAIRNAMKSGKRETTLLISTGNVGFLVNRFMHLFGQFNYGKKGILDLTHTRLFTFRTMKWLLEQSSFEIIEIDGIPVPLPAAVEGEWSRALVRANSRLINISKSLFSYQMIFVVRPRPTLATLMSDTEQHSEELSARIIAIQTPAQNAKSKSK